MNFFKVLLPNALAAHAALLYECRLKADSSLCHNIFERESLKIEIECTEIQKHRSRIKALAARKNDIAHGKSMTIANLGEYHDYESATICIMYELAIKSIEIADRKTYKASTV